MPNVQETLERRYDGLRHPQWVEAMMSLIGSDEYFRWHDSGDLQGDWHLRNIVTVCKQTPGTSHWLPTHEKALVTAYIRSGGTIPANLTVRLSATMIDANAQP